MNKEFAGKKVLMTSISAAVLLSLGAGQVLAATDPIAFEAKVTARADEMCSFTVGLDGGATNVQFRKGSATGQSSVEITGGTSTLTVAASGPSTCHVRSVAIDYADDGQRFVGAPALRGIPTGNGQGVFALIHYVSAIEPQDQHGSPTREGSRLAGKALNEFTPASYTGAELSQIFKQAGKPVPLVSSTVTRERRGATGHTNAPYVLGLSGIADRRSSSRHVHGAFSSATEDPPRFADGTRSVRLTIGTDVGDGIYDKSTFERDDTLAADGEKLVHMATLTVTPS